MQGFIKAPKAFEDMLIASMKDELLPVGTRIRFVKTLTSGPDEDGPGNLYARKGECGVVSGHGTPEGHWVKWDGWPHAFGAVHGKEFVAAAVQSSTNTEKGSE